MAIVTRSSSAAGNVLPLRGLDRSEVGRAGAKAANLGELSRAGFPVPDGLVITTEAFGKFVDANALDPACSQEKVASSTVPPELVEAIRAATIPLDGAFLAVRSSGVDEDLAGASYAGQYETFLRVRGDEEVLSAVRKCWASAFSGRVTEYREAQHQAGVPRMAVLVQRLVEADVAGVAFTANPVTGDRAETVVSAVKGLGERLVSGEASPDEWIVKGKEAISRSRPEGAIEAEDVVKVAEMARRVEEHFGTPQDVEWAIEKGRLYLLQARPITTLPAPEPAEVPIQAEVPPGFWERETTHFPAPISPMFRSAFLAPHAASMKNAFGEACLLAEGLDFKEIGGWVYQRLVPLGGKDRPAPPPFLMPLLIRLVPEMRDRIKGMVANARADKVGSYIEKWYAEWRPAQAARIAHLQAVDLAGLSDEELGEHLAAAARFLAESLPIHALISTADFAVVDLVFACRDLLGWDEPRSLDLLSGLSESTSGPTRHLADLARMAMERRAVRALLEQVGPGTADRLAEVDREFAAAFREYLREFGMRPLTFDILEPTIAEQPVFVLGLIQGQIMTGYNPERDAAALEEHRKATLAEARSLLSKRSPQERDRFEKLLARAERGYPIRDDHELYVTNAPFALFRYAVLELGDRLAQRGQIAQRDDVFFLEMDEALSAWKGHTDQRGLVAHRRGERAWALAHPGPATYGKNPGPPPSFAALPREARHTMESLMWELDRVFAPQQSQREQASGARALNGIAASPGQYTGPVRVLMTEAEFGKLRAGEVLVCRTTSPVWSVLFGSVGALVTDTGGILSHPAIIAREYRVPAVVATGNATKLLRDGQVVTVDGSTGQVHV